MVIAGDKRSPSTILGQRHFINCMVGTSHMILIRTRFTIITISWYTIRIIYELRAQLYSEVFPKSVHILGIPVFCALICIVCGREGPTVEFKVHPMLR